jgi:hypothetical protein
MHKPLVSLISAGFDETVPQGIPIELAHLPELETDEVRTWIAEQRDRQVFLVAGINMETGDTPALAVHLTQEEYLEVLAAMPH